MLPLKTSILEDESIIFHRRLPAVILQPKIFKWGISNSQRTLEFFLSKPPHFQKINLPEYNRTLEWLGKEFGRALESSSQEASIHSSCRIVEETSFSPAKIMVSDNRHPLRSAESCLINIEGRAMKSTNLVTSLFSSAIS
jgi:hypothetical protein